MIPDPRLTHAPFTVLHCRPDLTDVEALHRWRYVFVGRWHGREVVASLYTWFKETFPGGDWQIDEAQVVGVYTDDHDVALAFKLRWC